MQEFKKYLVEKEAGFYRYLINGKSWIIQKSPYYNRTNSYWKWELTIAEHNKDIEWFKGNILHHEKRGNFKAITRSFKNKFNNGIKDTCEAVYNPVFNEIQYK